MYMVFVSNYYNHHQSELSKEFYKKTDGQYTFIQTQPMENDRIKMGWEIDLPPYVKFSYINRQEYTESLKLINDADIVIYGSAPEKMIKERIKKGKLTFRYSERIFKKKGFDILRWIKYTAKVLPYRNKNLYYLFSSAYAASDYARCGVDLNKCYKWGYFPKAIEYENIDKLIELKHPSSILWVARLIEWKHPELPVMVAKRLKDEGYIFQLNLIGSGDLEEKVSQMIIDNGVQDYVHMLGSMKPDQVREHMEQSEIFLFTSDRNEGWGAVLNESMNSGCAVVASHAIGSVPFLLQNNENGLVYQDGDLDSLYNKTKWLLDHHKQQKMLGKCAYRTIIAEWNAKIAANSFVRLSKEITLSKCLETPISGICSKVEIVNIH